MTKSVSGAVQFALPHAPIRQLLAADRYDEAIAKLDEILAAQPSDVAASELLFTARFYKGEWAKALSIVEELIQAKPDSRKYKQFLISTLSNLKRFPETIDSILAFTARYGENREILNVLKVAYFSTKKIDEAIRVGQRVMEIRDAEVCARAREAPPVATVKEPGDSNGANVIVFSLWGADPIHNYGAMINTALAKTVYPGWICRFYVDSTVPAATLKFLATSGAEVIDASIGLPAVPGYFRRFLPLNDPAVSRFLVRDCDARLSAAEASLVDEWIASNCLFHIVRDHVLHNDLILAGLWGARANCGIDIADVISRYLKLRPGNKYGQDQVMLAEMIWPLIRSRCLVHDKYYRLDGVRTVAMDDFETHFGGGHKNPDLVAKELDRHGIPRIL